tara:strand:+ start:4998 stop:5909 length:912 start_codon:yes stop_codon:yes gene_type:complete
MRYNEIIKESMPDQKAIAKLKQDAAQLKAMKDSGNMDINKAMPMMQNMATMAAKADMGSKLLTFFEKMAGAIKKGIDTNVYSPKDLPTMQKAYDEIMAQMPQLKKVAADSRRLAVQHGGAGRQDVGEEDDPFIKAVDNSFGKGTIARKIGFSPTGELYKAIYRAIKAVMPEADEAEIKKAANAAADSMQESISEDMNAIVAKQGKKKHGQKYMDAARAMAQEKGRKLTPDERDKLRDKHSDNRKKPANETVAGDVGSVAQNMTPGKMISRNMYNSNGTMKNGLDYGNILGGPSKPKKAKKRRV